MKKYIVGLLVLTLSTVAFASPHKSKKALRAENAALQHKVDSLQGVTAAQQRMLEGKLDEINRRQAELHATPQKIYEASRNGNNELFKTLLFNHRANPYISEEKVSLYDQKLALFCAVGNSGNVYAVRFFEKYGLANPYFICSVVDNELILPTQCATGDAFLYMIRSGYTILLEDSATLRRGFCALDCHLEKNAPDCHMFAQTYTNQLNHNQQKGKKWIECSKLNI